MIPEGFHFLRPAWLAALVPVALLLWAGRRTAAQGGGAWRRVVDAHLLRHLLVAGDGSARRWPLAAAALGFVAACVALAGPTWERLPQPAFAAVDPTVVVLDMSPAMYATDLRPSRLARARHELQDVLARSRGGQVGLVLYADEPFVAVPLTDDARVIEELVPSLERGLMPPRASRTDRAIAQAQALLEQAGVPAGRILLLTTDAGSAPEAAVAAARAAAASGHTVSVLGVGANATDRATPSFDRTRLEELAAAGGGRFVEIRADASDVAALLPERSAPDARLAESGSSAQADAWRDVGAWLVLVPLLLAPLAFRRGLVVALALVLVAAAATPSEAGLWQDLWSRRDQQAQAALEAGDAASAAELFEDPAWKAAARYESGAFAESVDAYRALPGTENRYNLGNALARAGELEEAIAAYDEVLARAPEHADAKFNRDLVQRLLDQQRQQQQQQQGGEAEQQGAGGGEPQQDESASSGGGEQEQEQQQAGAQGEPEAGSDGAGSDAAQQQTAAAPHDEQAQSEDTQDAQAQDAQAQAAQDGTSEQQQAAAQQASAEEPRDQANDAASRAGAGDRDEAQADRTLAERLAEALGADADDPSEESPAQNASAPDDGTPSEQANASDAAEPLDERAQAREQMLRSIPDDPGGLLRAKIRRRYAEKRYAQEVMSW